MLRRIDPLWALLLLIGLAYAALFAAHLTTGYTPDRVFVTLPLVGLDVYWYGVLVAGGIFYGCAVVARLAAERATAAEQDGRAEADRRIWNPELVWAGAPWILVAGLIGARLYHILTPSPSMAALGITSFWDYLQRPWEMLNLRHGGLGIYGALAGGLLGGVLFFQRQRIPWLPWADLAVVGVAVGQFIGRWANFFNQELYGRPTTLPWGIVIARPLPPYLPGDRFHPAFLYESLWSLLAFFLLYRLATRATGRLLPGEIAATYVALYGLGRLLVETVRLDANMTGGLTTASWVSLALIAAAVGGAAARRLLTRPRRGL